MKKIEVIVAKSCLDDVKKAVREAGGHNICIMESFGVSTLREIGGKDLKGGGEVPLLKIELFLEDHEAERVADSISRELGGGQDVNVFLTKAEVAMRFHRTVANPNQ